MKTEPDPAPPTSEQIDYLKRELAATKKTVTRLTVQLQKERKARKAAERELETLEKILPEEIESARWKAKMKEYSDLVSALRNYPQNLQRSSTKRQRLSGNRWATKPKNRYESKRSAKARKGGIRLLEALEPEPPFLGPPSLMQDIPPRVIRPAGPSLLDQLLLGRPIPMANADICLEGLLDKERHSLRSLIKRRKAKRQHRGQYYFSDLTTILDSYLTTAARKRDSARVDWIARVMQAVNRRISAINAAAKVKEATVKLTEKAESIRLELSTS